MEIQPFAPQTSFDTPSVGSSANGPKDDLFSQMMDRAAAKAAERRPEADKPDRDKPEAKPPVAEPRRWHAAHPAAAKPAVEHTPPRSPRADEAHAAHDARKDDAPLAHAEEKVANPASKDEAPAKPAERTAKAAEPAKAERADTAHKAEKPEQAPESEATETASAADTADAGPADSDAETDESDTAANAPVEAAAVDNGAVLDALVVVEAEVTVVETTVQLIAADGLVSTTPSISVSGSAEASVEGTATPAPSAAAPDPALSPASGPTTTDPTLALTVTTTAADQTALAVAAGLQASVGAPAQPQPEQQDPQAPQAVDAVASAPPAGAPVTVTSPVVAPPDALPTAELAAAAAAAAPIDATPTEKTEAVPVDAKAVTAPSGAKTEAAPADAMIAAMVDAAPEAKPAKVATPKTEAEEFKLPETLSDLLGAKATEKAADKGTAKGQADTGKDGDTAPQQQPAATQAPASVQPQRTAGDFVTAAAEGMAVNEIAGADPVSAPADAPGNKDLGSGQILPTDAVKAAAPADAPPAFASLRPARGPNAPMGVPEQMAVNISRHVAEGNERFTIMLRPEELGRIDIRLEIAKDGRVSAIVAVDKPQTLELLQRDARGLERALQDAGLKADSGSLSFSLRGDGASSFADQRGDNQRGTGRRGRGFGGGDDDVTEVAAMQTLYLAPGRVDVRV